jgi:hypothetical protein
VLGNLASFWHVSANTVISRLVFLFNLYLRNPLEALSKAYRLKPDDISVLTRYGRSLWNRSRAMMLDVDSVLILQI